MNLILWFFFCENIKYMVCFVWSDRSRIAACIGFTLNFTVSDPINIFDGTHHHRIQRYEKFAHMLLSPWNPSEVSQYVMPHDLVIQLPHCKTAKASDHSRGFIWLPSYFLWYSLRVLKFDRCFCSAVCWLEGLCFAVCTWIDAGPCCVFRAVHSRAFTTLS